MQKYVAAIQEESMKSWIELEEDGNQCNVIGWKECEAAIIADIISCALSTLS